MQQNLRVMIVLGVTLLVLGSSGLFLWSYRVETICLDTNPTGCVDVDFPFDVLVSFKAAPNTLLQHILKVIIVLGYIMLFLGPCGCILWLNVVEIVCLDTNKTRWVNADLPLDVLVFFEGPQMPTCSGI